MDQYVTGAAIRRLREEKNMTQAELADRVGVSDKAVSKWENGKGLPDITLLEPLASVLGISTIELLSGDDIKNGNRSSNMLRSSFYVCPVCGNILHSMGETVVSCCGITLPPLASENFDEEHQLQVELVEDEWFVSMDHPMTKTHYISFLAVASEDRLQMVKLYPEGNAQARFKIGGMRYIYAYCNRDGLFRGRINVRKRTIE